MPYISVRIYRLIVLSSLLSLMATASYAQFRFGSQFKSSTKSEISYENPKQYVIGAIDITGLEFLDERAMIAITGLSVGDTLEVPGRRLNQAIKNLWEQGILGDVKVFATRIEGSTIFLEFALKERPRLSAFSFTGVSKSQAKELRERIRLIRGKVVTDAVKANTQKQIRKYFVEKGYLNVDVDVSMVDDTVLKNSVILNIEVEKNSKVKIDEIEIVGVEEMVPSWYYKLETLRSIVDNKNINSIFKADSGDSSYAAAVAIVNDFADPPSRTRTTLRESTIKSKMKKTKEAKPYRIFKASKFIRSDYQADKKAVIDFYNKKGFRDAEIVFDTIYNVSPKRIKVYMEIDEGQEYFFRNIYWKGNYLYSDSILSRILNIDKGDVYNRELLDRKLNFNPNGADISSLYLDDGYLFFNVTPVEIAVVGDSIDIEMQIYEGSQAYIDEIIVKGNTKTSDHVIRREIRTMPGEKFSRQDIIRTQRELSQLGYFDPEKMGITPQPDPTDGTVDIVYELEERPSDQLELSGGYGGAFGVIGTLGITFNNFSARKITKTEEWRPLPSGDGQRISARIQANGRQFQLYSFSFTEPWLGGRKPNSFTVGFNHSRQRYPLRDETTGGIIDQFGGLLAVSGVNLSIGKRLKWPDDFFTLVFGPNYQRYTFDNVRGTSFGVDLENGNANNLTFNITLARNSIDNPLFPQTGSKFSLSSNLAPPWSAFENTDYSSSNDRYKFIEYHKWMFDAEYFFPLRKNIVLATRAHYGFLGSYGFGKPVGPFDRFQLGGSGITGFNFILGTDIIGLRGYEDNSIVPLNLEPSRELTADDRSGGVAFAKYVTELRVALSRNPAATVWLHGFLEAGNNWSQINKFNPFQVYRSMGLGARIFMPAFGLMGIDYGWGLDDLPYDGQTRDPGFFGRNGVFHFIIGQQIR